MKMHPEKDKMTEDFLKGRIFPKNQDCKGAPSEFHAVGKSSIKPDAFAKVTGQAKYTADLKLPRMIYGKILRSTYEHAKIVSIDVSEALKMEGVIDAITGYDFDGRYGIIPWTKDERPLCQDTVRYVGDEIAAVAALSEKIASEALAKIVVTYETLAPVRHVKAAKKE